MAAASSSASPVIADSGKDTKPPQLDVAEATTEDMVKLFQELVKYKQDIPGRTFLEAAAAVGRLVVKLGSAFSIASSDIQDKINAVTLRLNEIVVRADEEGKQPKPAVLDGAEDAEKLRKDEAIRMSMHWIIDDEVRRGVATEDKGSSGFRAATRMTQRLMWFLDFTSVMLHKQFENESDKLKNSVWHAYDTTLAPYHGWVLRKTIGAALTFTPSYDTFKETVGGEEGIQQLKQLVPMLDAVRESMWAKYKQHGLEKKIS